MITEMVRADNDVPTEIWQDAPEHAAVLFQGHDGVFRIKLDNPDAERIRRLLGDARQQKIPVWFITQKADLALLDVLMVTDEKSG